MHPATLILVMLLPLMLGAAFLLGRHLQRRQESRDELSPVTRQHLDLFQGGQLSELAIENAKRHFRDLLERGEVGLVEASLRPGVHYVIQVRALTEIGTEDAGQILERQLHRRLSDDLLEQSWYWIDLASSLRSLNREESLPHLLRCADAAGESPLGEYFAAETICFLGFAGYVSQPETRLGSAAVRVLCRALEGLRHGVQSQVVCEARLGELIENLWDNRPETVHPMIARVFHEALRLLRRSPGTIETVAEEMAEREAYTWQMSRLAALEPMLEDYLQEAPALLCRTLGETPLVDHADILRTLAELREDAASAVLPLLDRPGYPHAELAVHVLTWSHDPRVGPFLRGWAARDVPIARRAMRRRQLVAPRHPSVFGVPYQGILRALRGHPSSETETFLLLAARDWDPTYRAAAISSLGWWEPLHVVEVRLCLQDARREPSPDVRQAARAALARLGERQALHWFRQVLTGENPQRAHEAIQLVATEGLTLLWPDLDQLADSENADIAHHAREASAWLCEDMQSRLR